MIFYDKFIKKKAKKMDKIKYTEKKLKLFAEAQQSIPETYGKNNFNYSMYQSIEQQSIDVLKEYLLHSERFDKNSYEKLHELIENCQKNGSSKLKLLAEQAKKKLEKVYTAQQESSTRQEEKKSVSSKPKKEGSYIEDNICMHMIIGSQLSISNQKIRNEADEAIKDQTMNCLQDYINAEKLNKDGIRNIKNLIAATKLSRDKELLRMAARAENKLYGSKERVNSSQTVTSKKHTSIGTKLKNILKKCKEVIVKHIKKIAIIGGIGLTGLVAGKYGKDIAKTFQNAKENKTEMYTTPIVQQEAKTKSITPQMVSQAQKQEKSQVKTTEMSKLEKAYKNRFDTALEILIGKTKRDILYKKIDNLAQDGKIKYQGGTTREWYAYAFTIYDKVAPNSPQNKRIKSFLNGESQSAEYINQLVIQAGRNGKGVIGSGTYSSYDNASEALQQQHKENNKQIQILQNEADR